MDKINSTIPRRFSGIARLYGTQNAHKIAKAPIAVVGVGGVGSWVVEALARSGVGQLTLIDADHVAESNINRQLPALDNTLGQAKIAALKDRIHLINPECATHGIDDFVTTQNTQDLIKTHHTWVIDCVDQFRVKAAMIAHCRQHQINIITVGGAGGQINPEKVKVSDLCCTEQDRLLARTRQLLRKKYQFSKKPSQHFKMPAVWSAEPVKMSKTVSPQSDRSLNCAGFGACMTVTTTFGMLATAHVLNAIAASNA